MNRSAQLGRTARGRLEAASHSPAASRARAFEQTAIAIRQAAQGVEG